MTEQNFKFLVKTLVSHYSTNHGIIAHMRNGIHRTPYSICVGTLRNAGKIMPTDCVVWHGEKLIYKGKLNSKRLYNKLDSLNLCSMELTTAAEMERGEGKYICLGNYKDCNSGGCKCKAMAYWDNLRRKHPELDPDNSLEKSPLCIMVTNAWKDGYKTARRTFKQGRKAVKPFCADNIHM